MDNLYFKKIGSNPDFFGAKIGDFLKKKNVKMLLGASSLLSDHQRNSRIIQAKSDSGKRSELSRDRKPFFCEIFFSDATVENDAKTPINVVRNTEIFTFHRLKVFFLMLYLDKPQSRKSLAKTTSRFYKTLRWLMIISKVVLWKRFEDANISKYHVI